MAATFKKVPRSVPSNQRSMIITSVVEGDQINVETILGRPAWGIKIVPADSTDVIQLKYNNRRRIDVLWDTPGQGSNAVPTPSPVYVVTHNGTSPTYTYSGSDDYTQDDIHVSFITVEDISFGAGGTGITITVW